MGIDEGLGVVLRTPRDGDAPRWLAMLADPEYRQFGTPSFVPVTTDAVEAVEKFARSIEDWDERRPGT